MRRTAILAVALLLPGCSGKEVDPFSVNIVADTFCDQPKRTWSVNDTKETIADARRFNAGWDARCGKKGDATQ